MYLKLCNFWFKNFSVPIYLNYIYELIKQRHMNKLVWVSKQNQSLVNVTGVLEMFYHIDLFNHIPYTYQIH